MTKPQSPIDKLFMRAKDIILIALPLGSIFLYIAKFADLPTEVAAQAKQIEAVQSEVVNLHDYTLRTDGRLSRIEDSQVYTNKGIDDIKVWLRAISKRRDEQ